MVAKRIHNVQGLYNKQTEASKRRDHRAASNHISYLHIVYTYYLIITSPLREEWGLSRTNVLVILVSDAETLAEVKAAFTLERAQAEADKSDFLAEIESANVAHEMEIGRLEMEIGRLEMEIGRTEAEVGRERVEKGRLEVTCQHHLADIRLLEAEVVRHLATVADLEVEVADLARHQLGETERVQAVHDKQLVALNADLAADARRQVTRPVFLSYYIAYNY
jgi:chromosome segregation ATPase